MEKRERTILQKVRAAFAKGFCSESAVFPVYRAEKDRTEEIGKTEIADLETEIPEDYKAASDTPGFLPEFDWRRKKGLEKLFAPGYIMEDHNKDGLSDALSFLIYLPADCSASMEAAACNLAFRFGMDTTAYKGKLAAYYEREDEIPPQEHAVIFRNGTMSRIYEEEKDGKHQICIEGNGAELESFVSQLCSRFPNLPEGRDWTEALKELTDCFAAKNEDGELLMAAFCSEREQEVTAYVSPRLEKRKEELETVFLKIRFQNYKQKQKVYEKEYDLPWEKEVFESILRDKVYPGVRAGDEIILQAALSEDKDVRGRLEDSVHQTLREMGADMKECHIFCAYKQGYSWIEEKVIPALQMKPVGKVEILFKPFLPEGETDWKDENGATPSYNNIKADDPEKWYDLPIRFLQELYPVEDLLVQTLQIQRNQISFGIYEGEEEITYQCRVWAQDGTKQYDGTYKAAYGERPYLDAFPGMGKVHPSTGYVKVWINGVLKVEERIRTDVECIWETYQKEVLEDCRKFVEEKYPDGIRADLQPLFSELRLEVTASEPDEKLPSREDMISTLDALHEDMYFVGSDYFKNYGIQNAGEILDAPGLILPVIKKQEGKPQFRVTLYEPLRRQVCVEKDEHIIAKRHRREEIELYIKEIRREDGKTVVVLETNMETGLTSCLVDLISRGLTETGNRIVDADILRFHTETEDIDARIPQYQEPEKNADIKEIDLMEDQLIGYDDYMTIIGKLRHVPGISVYRTAVSYEGREIYAIELLPKRKGYVSRTKRLTLHPSEIINARHHANEVSSTNAGFLLLKKILTEKKYENLADRLNLILVPMENVDGAALHYELQKENPYWKFHVARFNAIGKEFYYEHFKDDTIHTEAQGFTRLWEKALPDIVIDNHGVPSHEWEQQFSGYTSPSYKGFWLPRSLLYGYFWYVTNPEYKSNFPLNKKMEDMIAEAVNGDPEMSAWNKEWAAQFEKYAHEWMPKLFPADYYKEMIDYWIPFAYDAGHRYPSIRFPWITSVAYTSEVADETAQGSYLNLCAKAHVKHDEAVIQMLIEKSICVIKKQYQITEEDMVLTQIRQRPIVVKAEDEE